MTPVANNSKRMRDEETEGDDEPSQKKQATPAGVTSNSRDDDKAIPPSIECFIGPMITLSGIDKEKDDKPLTLALRSDWVTTAWTFSEIPSTMRTPTTHSRVKRRIPQCIRPRVVQKAQQD